MDVKLTVAGGKNNGTVFRLRGAETLVGRGTGSDIRIPSAAVSRRHCRLLFRDGYVSVEDLGSANGTQVNGADVKRQALRPGDRLEIGPVCFIVQYHLTQKAEKLLAQSLETVDLVEVEAVEEVEDVEEVETFPEVEAVEEMEEFPLDDAEPVEVDTVPLETLDAETAEVRGKAKKKDTTASAKRPLPKTKAVPPEKKEKKKQEPVPVDENLAVDFDPTSAPPAVGGDGDLRDILSQLE